MTMLRKGLSWTGAAIGGLVAFVFGLLGGPAPGRAEPQLEKGQAETRERLNMGEVIPKLEIEQTASPDDDGTPSGADASAAPGKAKVYPKVEASPALGQGEVIPKLEPVPAQAQGETYPKLEAPGAAEGKTFPKVEGAAASKGQTFPKLEAAPTQRKLESQGLVIPKLEDTADDSPERP